MSAFLIFDKLNKIPLYLLLFLMPLFFFPFVQNLLDFPKHFLFVLFVPLSLIGFLGKEMVSGEFVLKGSKIFYLSLILIFLSVLFSSLFSVFSNFSFLGYPSETADNFLTIFLFLIFIFLIINSFEKGIDFLPFLFFFLLAAAIISVLNLFQIYGIFLLPFNFAKVITFNTIGTTNSLALFMTVLLPLSLVLIFQVKGKLKIILAVITFLFFANIVLLNSKIAWLGLIVAILILFIFSFDNKRFKVKAGWIILLMIGLSISVFFYFFSVLLPGFPVLPPEVTLNSVSEISIIKGAFKEGLKNIMLGSGPATFTFDYSKYRPLSLNQTIFWGTRFSNGQSLFLDWILTKGLLGGLSLILFYFLTIYFFLRSLKQETERTFFMIRLGLFAGAISLIFISFLYPFNFTLYFTLFLLVSGTMLFLNPRAEKIDLSFSSRMIFVNLLFIIVIILSLGLFFFESQRFVAEMKYLKGAKAAQQGDFDRAINYVQAAANLNPSLDVYWRDLSQFYLSKANQALQDLNLPAEEKRKWANLTITAGAEAINKAINVVPLNVANWNVRGFFYRSLIGIEGAMQLSLASYEKAIELEPTSPFAFTEKARVYILVSQNLTQKEENIRLEDLDLAIQNLNKAIELKKDYGVAHYLLAVAFDQKGEIDKAISKLEETKNIVPQDVGIAFQLGLLYWRKEELEKAQAEFERALNLFSDYSNARYMLGLVYDKKGDKQRAREELERLANVNPDNEQVKKILDNLKNNLPALEGVISSQPPFQENPAEIKNNDTGKSN